jgi:hypothetical protein
MAVRVSLSAASESILIPLKRFSLPLPSLDLRTIVRSSQAKGLKLMSPLHCCALHRLGLDCGLYRNDSGLSHYLTQNIEVQKRLFLHAPQP